MPVVELDDRGLPFEHPEDTSTDSGAVNIAHLEATMVRPPQQERPAPLQPKTRAPTASKAISARELVRSIRARLREVNREIVVRKSLERERDQLRRLLSAALQKPAPVRTIRAAG